MRAFEFIAHDISGLTLADVTDNGTCLWIGTQEQFSDAEMQKLFFKANGHFYRVREYHG